MRLGDLAAGWGWWGSWDPRGPTSRRLSCRSGSGVDRTPVSTGTKPSLTAGPAPGAGLRPRRTGGRTGAGHGSGAQARAQ